MNAQRSTAFSLIELLVAVAIVGVLMGVLLPALGAARGQGRRAVCASNLHQLGIATTIYLHEARGSFWEYVRTSGGGAYWWFGYEPGGPGSGTHRPIDLQQSVLARYLDVVGEWFQCPDFPYEDANFYPKFEHPAASYGYNWKLSGLNGFGVPVEAVPPERLTNYAGREAEVFVFADAIHFDHPARFNEGHYLSYVPTTMASGYAHFRHQETAQYVLIDGHVDSQRRAAASYRTVAGSDSSNLLAKDGSNRIYGY